MKRLSLCITCIVFALLALALLSGCAKGSRNPITPKVAEAGSQATAVAVVPRPAYAKSSSHYPPKVFMRAMNELERPENYHSSSYGYTTEDKFFFDASHALAQMAREDTGNVRGAAIRYINAVHSHVWNDEALKAYGEVVNELKKAKVKLPKKYQEYLE